MNEVLPSLCLLTSIDLRLIDPTPPDTHPHMLRTLCTLTTLRSVRLAAADQPQCLTMLQHVASLVHLHALTVVNAQVNPPWNGRGSDQQLVDLMLPGLGHTPTPLVLPQRLRRLELQQSVAVHGTELTHIGATLVGLTHLYVLGCCVRSNDAACAVAGTACVWGGEVLEVLGGVDGGE